MAAAKLRIVGLDLSLSSSGVSDGTVHQAFATPSDWTVEARLDRQVWEVMRFVHRDPGCDLAVIEGGAFARGSQSAAAEHLSALRLMVRHRLWRESIPFAVVPPSTLKLYTAGHGQATKQRMIGAIFDRHGVDLSGVKVKDGRRDQADALALAAMGYAAKGQPLPTVGPPGPLASLNAVQWPELLSE